MASIIIRGEVIYAKFRDHTGRWVRRRTDFEPHEKKKAKEYARDLEKKAQRQRDGLEPLPEQNETSLWELCEWWLENACPNRSLTVETARLKKQVGATSKLGRLKLPLVTGTVLQKKFEAMVEEEDYEPSTANHLRAILHAV